MEFIKLSMFLKVRCIMYETLYSCSNTHTHTHARARARAHT